MHLSINEDASERTIAASNDEEAAIIEELLSRIQPNSLLEYGGRNDGPPFAVFFSVGNFRFTITGTNESDVTQVKSIRDCAFFGSPSSLTYLRQTEVDGRIAIVVTHGTCKFCGKRMASFIACEWGVCNACAKICSHNYVSGAMHGGKTHLGVGSFCDICGRGKPDTEMEMILGEDKPGWAEINPI